MEPTAKSDIIANLHIAVNAILLAESLPFDNVCRTALLDSAEVHSSLAAKQISYQNKQHKEHTK